MHIFRQSSPQHPRTGAVRWTLAKGSGHAGWFFISPSLWVLLSLSHLFNLSLCYHAAANTKPVRFTFKCLHSPSFSPLSSVCFFYTLSLAHSQSSTSHSLIKSKRRGGSLFSTSELYAYRSRPPQRIYTGFDPHYAVDISKPNYIKIQIECFLDVGDGESRSARS